jgi:hypothetical protein
MVLTKLMVAQSPYWFVDMAAPPASQRFYRIAAPATPSGMALIPAGPFTMGDTLGDGLAEGLTVETPTQTIAPSRVLRPG